MFTEIHPKSLVDGDYLRSMDRRILFILSAVTYTMTVKLNAGMYVGFVYIGANNVNVLKLSSDHYVQRGIQ